MEKQKNIITVSQLFVTMFTSQMIMNLTYNPVLSGSSVMWAHIASAIISLFFTFIIIIPLCKLRKISPNKNIISLSFDLFGKPGKIINLIYSIYFLATSCITMSLFSVFVSNAINPNIPIQVLITLIVLVAIYGAYKGIEGIVRASSIIFVLIVLALGAFIFSLIFQINPLNYTITLENEQNDIIHGVLVLMARMSSLPAIAMLYPKAKGKFQKGIGFWIIALFLTISVIVVILVGAIGSYVKTHIFPVYAATGVIEVGIFKRLDSLYLSIFTMGVFVRVSLFLYLFANSTSQMFKSKKQLLFLLIAGIITITSGILFSDLDKIHYFSDNFIWIFCATMTVGFIIPLILFIVKKCKKKFIPKLAAFLAIMMMFSGCSYGVPLNNRILIQGIGVDKEDDVYTLTVDIFDTNTENTNKENDNSIDNAENARAITLHGHSIYDAFMNITKMTGKTPLYFQNLVLIIGKKSAQDGVNSLMDFFVRYYESRPAIDIFITNGKASDILHAKINNSYVTAQTLSALAKTTQLNLMPTRSNLVEFIGNMHSKGTQAYALTLDITNNDDNNIELSGIGVFREDKLVGIIDRSTCEGVSLVLDKNSNGGCIVIDIDPIGKVSYDIEKVHNSVHAKYANDKAEFDINISINANVYEIDRDIAKKMGTECFNIMSDKLNDRIKYMVEHSIQTLIQNYGSDVFSFGKHLLTKVPSFRAKSPNDILDALKTANYNVTIKTKIKKIGQEANPI